MNLNQNNSKPIPIFPHCGNKYYENTGRKGLLTKQSKISQPQNLTLSAQIESLGEEC